MLPILKNPLRLIRRSHLLLTTALISAAPLPFGAGTVRAQDALRLNLRRAGADVAPLGEVLVFQAHTKIIDGALADERTREALTRHLAGYVKALGGG